MSLESQEKNTVALIQSFDNLIKLLEQERRSLLKGDAVSVTEIALKKDELAQVMEEQKKSLADINLASIPDLSSRAKSVQQIAEHNHTLLNQMYQYYSDMTHMLRQTLGQGNTYGRNGGYENGSPTASIAKSQVL